MRATTLLLSALVPMLSLASEAEAQVTISIGDAEVMEGDSAAENVILSFPLTLSGVPTKDTSVRFSTAPITATANIDFAFVSNVLVTIPAGQTTGVAQVPIIEDLVVEPDETLSVTLSSPSNAFIGVGTATGTIVDDDDAVPQIPALGPLGGLLLAAALLLSRRRRVPPH